MAVLETLAPKDLLTLQERLYLTDILRAQAVYILPAEQNWTIMTRENINVMLPPGKAIEDCEGSCLAETGKNIAADYVAQARISQFGKALAITAEVYETASSKLVASFVGKGENVEDVEKIIKEQAPTFFKKVRNNALNGFGYVSTNNSFSFQGTKKFIVEIQTTPSGAIPTFDGKAFPQCTSTPCKIQLEAGEHRLVISKERFEDLDTLINVVKNEQQIKLDLVPNVGYINIAPKIPNSLKNQGSATATINGQKSRWGANELSPGLYSVLITHSCFDPLELNVMIQKGERTTISDSLVRGIGGLELDVVKNGTPQAVPVFIDGNNVGTTPFAGEVPLCSKIEIENAGKREQIPVEIKYHEVVKKTYELTEKPAATKADETRQKAEVAYAELDGKKVTAKPTEDSSAQKAAEEATENKAKSFWGGIVAGVIYNDFYSSHFGLNNIKNETGYKHTVDSDEDLLSNFWGIGFKAGFGGLFIASPYFGLHGELGLAFRQGTGKTNLTVTLTGKDKTDKKSDLEVEYTASSNCIGPGKSNLQFDLQGRAGDCSLVTAVQNRPHLGLCLGHNVPLQGRQGSRGCIPNSPGESGLVSREAKDSALLSSRTGYFLDPTEWPKGSQYSCEVWREDQELLSRSGRKRSPQSRDDGGFSRAAAPVWGFSRGTTGTSGSLS